MIDWAISAEKTMGAFCVLTRRAPSRCRVRRAAMRPISSGSSSFFTVRAFENQ